MASCPSRSPPTIFSDEPKFLNSKDSEVDGTLRRVIGLLLQAIDLHAVEGDSVDYAHFRSGMQEIAKQLSDETPVEEILVMAGAVAESLRDYSQRTSRYVRAHSAEYQNMVSMLTHVDSRLPRELRSDHRSHYRYAGHLLGAVVARCR